jgi:hypothetical protein
MPTTSRSEVKPDYDARLERLHRLAGGCMAIYNRRTQGVLEGDEECPRFALLTAESGHDDNPNLTVHDTWGSIAEQATGEMNEEYCWTPQQIVDLETGEAVGYRLLVKVGDDA